MRFLLVDGHYYAYRSFYAIKNLSNSKGDSTNAIYGFVKTLRRMIQDLKPDCAAVVFDTGLPERRLKLQPEYKANRIETPASLSAQIPSIEEISSLIGFQVVRVNAEEADDVIATLVKKAAPTAEIVLATNDKDLMQLVTLGVKIYQTIQGSKGSEYQLLGEKEIKEKWGVEPNQIGEILALTGDASDNIPGVPGIGPKTAANLIQEFGSIEELLRNLDKVKSDKHKKLLEENRTQILSNHEMVRLDYAVPVEGNWREWSIKTNYELLIKKLQDLEFRSLLKEVENEANLRKSTRQIELF